jgi:hypothetical protein
MLTFGNQGKGSLIAILSIAQGKCPKMRHPTFLFCSLVTERFVVVLLAPTVWLADLDFCAGSVYNEVPFDPCQLQGPKQNTANWQHHSNNKKN